MADWFKFYNDDLDSGGLQYCMSEQPLVTSVWLVILSEASKNRSNKFKWDEKDFRLLGFSRKINISPAIFNQCINLLTYVGYIKICGGALEIPGWIHLQSDYARGLQKGYYNKKKTIKKLASISEVSSVRGEERRGEEIRREESAEAGKVASLPRAQKPSIEAVKLQAAKIGLEDFEADKFFNYYESNGWRVGRNPMKSWTHALSTWKLNAKNYGSKNTTKPNPRNAGVVGDLAENARRTAEIIRQRQAEAEANQSV